MVSEITPVGGSHPMTVNASPQPVIARPAVSSAPVIQAPRGPSNPEAAVAEVNQHLQQATTDLKLQMDSGSGRTVFQVVQQGTGQVVIQIPSEEVLGMSRRMRELESQSSSSGALVDKKG